MASFKKVKKKINGKWYPQFITVGTFYYTASSPGNGMPAADKVTAAQITGVRVRFIREKHTDSGGWG